MTTEPCSGKAKAPRDANGQHRSSKDREQHLNDPAGEPSAGKPAIRRLQQIELAVGCLRSLSHVFPNHLFEVISFEFLLPLGPAARHKAPDRDLIVEPHRPHHRPSGPVPLGAHALTCTTHPSSPRTP